MPRAKAILAVAMSEEKVRDHAVTCLVPTNRLSCFQALVVVTEDGKVSRINIPDGAIDEIPFEIGKEVRAPLSGDGPDRVYLGDRDGRVHSIDLKDWGNRSQPFPTKKR